MANFLSNTRIYGTANVDGILAVGTVTPNTSTSNITGSLQVTGGMGISGNVFISTNNNSLSYNTINNELALLGTNAEIKMQGVTTEPASPAANTLLIYSKSIAGRMMPKWKDPSGFDYPFQAGVGHNKIGWWNVPGNSTTIPAPIGINAGVTGTVTTRTNTATNIFTRSRRIGFNSSAAINQRCGLIGSVGGSQFTVGTGTGLGGFFYVCRFGSADTLASAIMFVGMGPSTMPASTSSPATFTNSIGVGCATGDTNMSIYYGGSAAQTPIALGASFPAKTASTDLYELVLFAPSNSNTIVHYRVTNLSTSVEASGTLTAATAGTQLPAATTFLGSRAYRTNNATPTAVLIDIVSVYIETDT